MSEDPSVPDEWYTADQFVRAFQWAQRHNLQHEFTVYFFDKLGVPSEQIDEAIRFARREWDL